MGKNRIEEVGKLLGIKMGEKIYIKNCYGERINGNPFHLENNGLINNSLNNSTYVFTELLSGEYEIETPVLDNIEKRYLENFLRPFKDRVKTIKKVNWVPHYSNDVRNYLTIDLEDHLKEHSGFINLPYFDKDTMYKGMKVGKEYTLKELGLFEEEVK